MKKTSTNMMPAKRLAVAVAAVCATMSVPVFAGDDMKGLMELLLKKGVITQQEYDQHIKAAEDAAENQAFKEKRLSEDVAKLNKAAEKSAKSGLVKTNGLGIESADGNFTANLEGRLHMDFRSFSGSIPESTNANTNASLLKGSDAFELRRARLGINGTVYKDIDYKVLMNMVGSDTNNVEEAWVNYKVAPAAQLRFGRFKHPFNLEEYGTSSNNLDFMQRSYVNQIAPAKQIGAMIHGVPTAGTTYAASIYQNGFAQVSTAGNYEGAARATVNFSEIANFPNNTVAHLGLAGTSGKFDLAATSSSASTTFITIRDENRGSDIFTWKGATSSASADKANTVDRSTAGLEVALAYDAFKFQAEYAKQKLSAVNDANTDLGNGHITTQYVSGIYNLTGEKWSDTYKNGGFGATKPNSNFSFSGGGTGAWQLGMRVSQFKADDFTANSTSANTTTVTGGKTYTVGLNWLLNPNARFMLNYAHTKLDSNLDNGRTGTGGDTEDAIALRAQYNF